MWLRLAEVDGLEQEASEFIKEYIQMISARVKNLYFTDESNGDIYRALHVNKNIIQSEILNPDSQPFVFPIPVPQPPPQQPAQQQLLLNNDDDDY